MKPVRPWKKAAVLAVCLALLQALAGCCTVCTVSRNSWCLTEHRTENRKIRYSPEAGALTVELDEKEQDYFFPFDYAQKIPWTSPVRHHVFEYRLNRPPGGALVTQWKIEPAKSSRRFVRGKDGTLPSIKTAQILLHEWDDDVNIYYKKPLVMHVHPADLKYLSAPFTLEAWNWSWLLIPCGSENGMRTFYTPRENSLIVRKNWGETHPAVVWRAVWVLPAVTADVLFFPFQLVWLAIHGF